MWKKCIIRDCDNLKWFAQWHTDILDFYFFYFAPLNICSLQNFDEFAAPVSKLPTICNQQCNNFSILAIQEIQIRELTTRM